MHPTGPLTLGLGWAALSAATEGWAAVAVADAATETPSEPRASQRAAGSYAGVHCNVTRDRPSLHEAMDPHDETGTHGSVSKRTYS